MSEKNFSRLSDRILEALELAISQKDVAIAEILSRALDLAMTRNAGGKDFVERRTFSGDVEKAIDALEALRREQQG